ncbi:hypothetical protein [Aeromonas enteropelogenes]|uniref:hypothetical protein n=1 Tax=Aeromonas enteropelogenes TaxID=29489 RepID=UPI003BA16050
MYMVAEPDMVINLFNLKETNGMFFYALDYMADLDEEISHIIVNKRNYGKFVKSVGNKKLKICGFWGYVYTLLTLFFTKSYIFCPTPHPVPFLRHQLVVLHDSFPFTQSKWAAFKKILFKCGVFFSSCDIGYINKTDSYHFVAANSSKRNKLLYLPNLIPSLDVGGQFRPLNCNLGNGSIHIGLFGSDSPKKRYSILFDSILAYQNSNPNLAKVCFYIYGHENLYSSKIINDYSTLNIQLVSSDDISLAQFIEKINVVVSVALTEGFGRPIAAAFRLGIPCFLLKTPVNDEFFQGACIYSDVDVLVDKLFKYFELNMIASIPVCNMGAINENHIAFELAKSEILLRGRL